MSRRANLVAIIACAATLFAANAVYADEHSDAIAKAKAEETAKAKKTIKYTPTHTRYDELHVLATPRICCIPGKCWPC